MIVKPHPYLKNIYVSDTGIVYEYLEQSPLARGVKFPECSICCNHIDVYGYKIISLRAFNYEANGMHKRARKKYKAHKLVAETFIPNPNGCKYVDHIDNDKTNIHISNLRWVTLKENNSDSIARRVKHYDLDKVRQCMLAYIKGKPVKQISADYGVTTNSLKDWFKCRTQKRVWKEILNDYRKGILGSDLDENRVEYILKKMETVGS